MDFQVGDQVIHWNLGVGKIVQIEEVAISGRVTPCYVVEINQLTVWVPIDQAGASSLRFPTAHADFEDLMAVLRSPGEPLPTDHLERKAFLATKLRTRDLVSICQVIRDLTFLSTTKKLNEKDKETLEHARNLVISEWKLVYALPQAQVEKELGKLISSHLPPVAVAAAAPAMPV